MNDATSQERASVSYTIKVTHYLDEAVPYLERCLKVIPKNYKWELEGCPAGGWNPTKSY